MTIFAVRMPCRIAGGRDRPARIGRGLAWTQDTTCRQKKGVISRFPIPEDLNEKLRGRTITALRRRVKYLLIDLDNGWTVLSHLGMSGRWTILRDDVITRPGRFAHGGEIGWAKVTRLDNNLLRKWLHCRILRSEKIRFHRPNRTRF